MNIQEALDDSERIMKRKRLLDLYSGAGPAVIGYKQVQEQTIDSVVDQINQRSAELINLCETLKSKDPRLAAMAQTTYKEAAKWAVKAATA